MIMLPGDSLIFPVLFQLSLSITGTVITCLLALLYLRRVRLERPTVGRFNGRDVAVLFVFIVGLPLLYLVVPMSALLVFFTITFASALSIGLRPLLAPTPMWLIIGLLVGANIWMTRALLGTVRGWQIFWLENSIVVIAAAVIVANLYVQGGMQLKHVGWFGLILACYDALFSFVWPVTNALTQKFLEYPLNPAIGFRLDIWNAALGMGDLLVYAMFVIAVHKAYGAAATKIAMVIRRRRRRDRPRPVAGRRPVRAQGPCRGARRAEQGHLRPVQGVGGEDRRRQDDHRAGRQ
jgi:hypothetical protein